MKSLKTRAALLAGFATAFSNAALADADIVSGTLGVTTGAIANVDICVVVPEILIFGVGPRGDDIAKIEWTNSVTDGTYSGLGVFGTDPFAPIPATAVTAAVSMDGGTGSVAGTTVTLPAYLYTNTGRDAMISSEVTAGVTGGGAADVLSHDTSASTIAIAEFASGAGTDVPQPAFEAGGTQTVTITNTDVINEQDDWTYTYTPVTFPEAGTYSARITYTATSP